jgi:hypothetical protein
MTNINTVTEAREICNRSLIGAITKSEVENLLNARVAYLQFHAHGMPDDRWNDHIHSYLHQALGNCA